MKTRAGHQVAQRCMLWPQLPRGLSSPPVRTNICGVLPTPLGSTFIMNINNFNNYNWVKKRRISHLIVVLPAISSWPKWIDFSLSPNQKRDQIWTTLFPVCLLWAVWLFGIPFPRKFSRCSIYYAQAAKNLWEDNTWTEKKTLCWPDSPFSHCRENFMNSLGKDKAFSSSTRPLILRIPVKSPQYIPTHVLTPRAKKQSLL